VRYFLDPNGERIFRTQPRPDDGHVEIASEVLARLGIIPLDREDHYVQMFCRGFARIVEHKDGITEVEFGPDLTAEQMAFVTAQERRGRQIKLFRTTRRFTP
jgi:hypothetical protein